MASNATADELSDAMESSSIQTEDLDLKKPRNWITVNWVREHFEEAEGVNISRSSIYDSYLEYAVQANIEPVNTASFGKLMRTVFPQLSTRRLGVRGQSKYHYNGIRVRVTSALLEKVEVHEKTGHGTKRSIRDAMKSFMTQLDVLMPINNQGTDENSNANSNKGNSNGNIQSAANATSNSNNSANNSYQTQSLPEFPSIDESRLPVGFQSQNLSMLINAYYSYCQELLVIVSAGNFVEAESLVCNFWQKTMNNVLRSMMDIPVIIDWIGECDIILYSTIALMLVPDILRHIPMERMQLMRTFARNLQGWIAHYMQSIYSPAIIQRKLIIAKSFLETLKKSTVVNHVTEAARSALLNEARVQDMGNELARLDFDTFKADLLWATQYSEEPVRRAFTSIKELLTHKAPVEMWANWLELLLGQCVRSMQAALALELGGNQDVLFLQKLPFTMRHTVVRWSYFADIILRELSLRSSPVFGSFHLLRLFMNEYLSLIAEKMVAHVRLAFYQERTSEQVWRAIHPLMVFYLEINQYFPGNPEASPNTDYETNQPYSNANASENQLYNGAGSSLLFFANSTDNFNSHQGSVDEGVPVSSSSHGGALYGQHVHPSAIANPMMMMAMMQQGNQGAMTPASLAPGKKIRMDSSLAHILDLKKEG